jgi:hypothetical protein
VTAAEAATAPAKLAYADPPGERPRVALFRLAQICWIAPLSTGVLTVAAYAVTFAQPLVFLGLGILVAGGVMFGIGAVCVTIFRWLLRRCDPDERALWSRRASVLLGLLVLNIPAAIACASAGLYLSSRVLLTLVNETSAPITDVTLASPGQLMRIDRLAPGERRRFLLAANGEGQMTFQATQNGTALSGVAIGYVTQGARSTVRFTPSGPAVRDQ